MTATTWSVEGAELDCESTIVHPSFVVASVTVAYATILASFVDVFVMRTVAAPAGTLSGSERSENAPIDSSREPTTLPDAARNSIFAVAARPPTSCTIRFVLRALLFSTPGRWMRSPAPAERSERKVGSAVRNDPAELPPDVCSPESETRARLALRACTVPIVALLPKTL